MDIEQIRVRIMSEAYDLADRGDSEGYNAIKVMCGDVLESIAAVVAAEREKSLRLWMLLDDIDTADDIAKADDKLYRSICQKYQKKRWDILSEAEVDAAIRARSKS